MKRGLRELLYEPRPFARDRSAIERLLGVAACVPADPELRARAKSLRAELPEHMQEGSSLLVATSGADTSLWLLEPGPQVEGAPIVRDAIAQMRDALWLVPRSLAALARADVPREHQYGARLLAHDGDAPPPALDGRSFGLAMCLAVASRMLALRVPSDLVACAEVAPTGELVPVGALNAKLGIVARFALGVRRVLVAASQLEEAEAIASPLGIDVCPVATLGGALEHAFGAIAERLERAWAADPELAKRAARHFHAVARDGNSALVDWKPVEATCERLTVMLGVDSDDGYAAHLAARIASRHRGAVEPLVVRDAWIAARRRPHRLRVLAHLVQHAADSADPTWEEHVSRARAELAPEGDEHVDDLKLLGAIGRAYAAWLRYREAELVLHRAVRGFVELDEGHQGSYALCELLRVLGIEGHRDALGSAIHRDAPQVLNDPRTSESTRAFVSLAIGRALVQSGDPGAALAWLDGSCGVVWERREPHLIASRLRWLANALRAAGRGGEAARVERELQDRDASFAALLARLDGASTDDERRPLIRELEAQWPGDVARIRSLLAVRTLEDEARALTTHFRY